MGGANINIPAQDVTYSTGTTNNGAELDGATNYLDLGSHPGTCLTHLEFCQTLHVQFTLYFSGQLNGDQYIMSRTTADSSLSGFYLRYANLNPFLPTRRYFQAGVKHGDREWNATFHLETERWMGVHLLWSYSGGFEVWVDGILAVQDTAPITVVGLSETTDTAGFIVGRANTGNTNYAKVKVDEINVWDGAVGPDGLKLTDGKYCHTNYNHKHVYN